MPTRVVAAGQVEDDYPGVLLAGEVLARGQRNFMRQLTGAWEEGSSKRCCRCTNCPRWNGHSRMETRTFAQAAVASRGLVWRRRDAAAAHPAGCERRVGWANPSLERAEAEATTLGRVSSWRRAGRHRRCQALLRPVIGLWIVTS